MDEQTQDEKQPEQQNEQMKDLEVPDEQADDVTGGRKAGEPPIEY